jgi:probable F420-dependent oxidoreductase
MNSRQRIQVGLKLPTFISTKDSKCDQIIDFAKRAEELGFDSLWSSDILTVRKKGMTLDPLLILAGIATVTRRVKLGTAILLLPQHHPIQLARSLLTLDHLSNGRLMIAIGVGHNRKEAEVLGVPWAERGDRADEIIRAMRQLWSGARTSFNGKHVRFDDVAMLPTPVNGSIPIWIGAEKGEALRRVAALADGWVSAGFTSTLPLIREAIDEISRMAKEYGRSLDDIVVANNIYVRVSTKEKAFEEAKHHLETRYSYGGIPPSLSEGGIFGDVENCIEQFRARIDAGVTHFDLSLTGDDFAQVEIIAKEILPKIR